MDSMLDMNAEVEEPETVRGIVIHGRWEEPRRPAISAFIWGGKVAPVPMLPYGRAGAA